MKALITGATGFVGQRLIERLVQPTILTRDAQRARQKLGSKIADAVAWDLSRPPPVQALEGIDAVFHLAGEPVAEGRWTAAKKARIRDSRVLGTQRLVEAIRQCSRRPRVLVSASAVGYYGSRGDEWLEESSPPGSDFLARVCQEWEQEARAAEELGVRVVSIRIGIVLGRGGGALARMLLPFRLGLGSPLGSGQQYMPWIHLEDLVRLFLFAAEQPELRGPVNGVAPHPVTNREFTRVLARVLRRSAFLPPVPALVLRLALGEFVEVLLASQRVRPAAALAAGFSFQYPELEAALRDLLTGAH
jgi:uncharacterized protein (TIGR01777 family)